MARIHLGQRAGITPTPMLLIGTYNDDGTPNAMVATWGVTATWEVVELNLYKVRKTTGNIKTRKAFTVSCVDTGHIGAMRLSGYGFREEMPG